MSGTGKLLVALGAALGVLVLSVGVGSVWLSPDMVVRCLLSPPWAPATPGLDPNLLSIVWQMRLPRAVLAFLAGAALSASGAVMQSLLQNPLASSYTLGVSSGASLAAALVMVSGLSSAALGLFTLPAAGFAGGLATVFLALACAARLNGQLDNQTIILVGVVFSLFVNAILTLVTALSRDHLEQLLFWQMGGFSGRTWSHAAVLAPVSLLCIAALVGYHRDLDIISFGEEQALSMGVELRRTKIILLGL